MLGELCVPGGGKKQDGVEGCGCRRFLCTCIRECLILHFFFQDSVGTVNL